MSNLDLTEALEAAARGWFESAPEAPPWDDIPPMVKARARETLLPGVTAAAPVIAAQIAAAVDSDVDLFADIEALCVADENPSTLADKIQDLIAARLREWGSR